MKIDQTLYHNQPLTDEVAIELMNMSLEEKDFVTYQKITEWYIAYNGKCYVSFSGGKDSTLLSYLTAKCLAENEWYKTPLVLCFFDTGLEYPEIRKFVFSFADWLRAQFPQLKVVLEVRKPEMNFREVIQKYGYPVISKEVAHAIKDARNCPSGKVMARFHGAESNSMIKWTRYAYLLDAPFKIDHRCCDAMKKRPAHYFEKETGLTPLIGTMASESILRKKNWKRDGCNAFDAKRPVSRPMSFWNENDVLRYLYENQIPICSVYGNIVQEENTYRTTGCDRTGCMFCCFGAQSEKEPNRFQRMAKTHPYQYQWMLKPFESGGLGLKEVLDFLKIKY